MNDFDANNYWLCIFFFPSLGIFVGVTMGAFFSMASKLLSVNSLVVKILSFVYILAVFVSLFVLLSQFVFIDSDYFVLDVMLFVMFFIYFSIFTVTARKGGPILSRIIK